MDVLVPLVIMAVAGSVLLMALARRFGSAESEWLVRILIPAFLIRLGCATLFAAVPSLRIFHEDATGYERVGLNLAAGWLGEGPPADFRGWGQNTGYFYFCAVLYYVSFLCRVVPSYVNALLGTVNVFLVYRLAREFFHIVVARRAALLTAFIPSMILWSAVALKDTPMTFLIVLSLSSCVRLKQRFSLGALLGTVLPVLAIQPLRFYIVYLLCFAILLSLFLERGFQAVAGISKQLAFLTLAVLLLAMVGASGRVQEGAEVFSLERVSTFRQGLSTTADSGFAQDVDISTPGRALAFLPIGMSYLLLSPFPWQFGSLRAALAGPEMLLWWLLIPSLIRGIFYTIKTRFSECSPLLVFALILTLAYSLVHGNVGSGFRQRAQIFVFLFIFASLGQYRTLCRRRGLDERLLLRDIRWTPGPEGHEAASPRAA